jgi:hypothetical protein
MSTEEKTNDMGKNQDPLGLLRRKGARYYGRFSIGGKTKFVALIHTRLEAAKIRFPEANQDARTLRRSRNCPNSTRTKIPPKDGIAETPGSETWKNRGVVQKPDRESKTSSRRRFRSPASRFNKALYAAAAGATTRRAASERRFVLP